MRKGTALVMLIVGMSLGFGVAFLVGPPLVEAHAGDCSVPKAFGTLRTARDDGRLFFEDSAGVVRAVDTHCEVKQTIGRE